MCADGISCAPGGRAPERCQRRATGTSEFFPRSFALLTHGTGPARSLCSLTGQAPLVRSAHSRDRAHSLTGQGPADAGAQDDGARPPVISPPAAGHVSEGRGASRGRSVGSRGAGRAEPAAGVVAGARFVAALAGCSGPFVALRAPQGDSRWAWCSAAAVILRRPGAAGATGRWVREAVRGQMAARGSPRWLAAASVVAVTAGRRTALGSAVQKRRVHRSSYNSTLRASMTARQDLR